MQRKSFKACAQELSFRSCTYHFLPLQAAEEDAQEQESDDEDASESKLNTLKRQLEDCRTELFEVYDQVQNAAKALFCVCQ